MKTMLSRKLIATNAAMIACLLILGTAAVVGLLSLGSTIEEIAEEYEESRMIEQINVHTTMARGRLGQADEDPATMVQSIDDALAVLDAFLQFQEHEEELDVRHQDAESSFATTVRKELLAARSLSTGAAASPRSLDVIAAHVDEALANVNRLLEQTDVSGVRDESLRKALRTAVMVAVLTLLIILGGVATSVLGYRSVILPLRKLRRGVRAFAGGDLSHRLDPRVDQEFVALVNEFNRMAGELQTLYRDLEEKVESKSRELVRSERLASVGFLAAGVAHEINNPLSIMTGYAEMGQKWLDGEIDDERRQEIRDAMQIIRQEAFRCKQIIQQLLSLSRMGDGVRGKVALSRVADEVTTMLSALEKYRHHRIDRICHEDAAGPVWGNESELKQVVLNLAVNALESIGRDSGGHVTIAITNQDEAMQLVVDDNGSGMTPETLEHVFEPFYTRRSGAENRGTGLGLSICHAIIESHGGTIRAESDGPGRGSRFTITLPIRTGAPVHAN